MKIEKLLIIPEYNDLDRYMKLVKQYDCGFEYNDFFLPNVLDNDEICQQKIEGYGKQELPSWCTMHGAFLDVTIFSDDARIREVSDLRVEQSLIIAAKLGVKGVVFHTNYVANFLQDAYREGWVAKNAAYWKEKLARYPGLMIYMENMFDSDWELLAKLGERMQDEPRFGVCFDYAHAHVFGNPERIDEWVKALSPYIKHVHINDNDFVSDLHLPVGAGRIDWQHFKRLYQEYMSKASVLIEVKGVEAIEQSLQALQAL